MAYFEATKVEESLTLLRSIFRILKPLSFITGGGSNRLSVDVNGVTTLPSLSSNTLGTVTTVSTVSNITAGTVTANCNINASQTLGTVTTVGTVNTVTTVGTVNTVTAVTGVGNLTGNIGGVNSFDLMKAMSRTAYATGIRANIT